MANNVFINDAGYIEVTVDGDQTSESVQQMGDQIQQMLAHLVAQHKPLLVLDDITRLGNTTSEAREAVAALARTIPYDRLAMLGDGSVMMRVGTNLMLSAIGKGNKIHYFDNRDEAVAWLLGRR